MIVQVVTEKEIHIFIKISFFFFDFFVFSLQIRVAKLQSRFSFIQIGGQQTHFINPVLCNMCKLIENQEGHFITMHREKMKLGFDPLSIHQLTKGYVLILVCMNMAWIVSKKPKTCEITFAC